MQLAEPLDGLNNPEFASAGTRPVRLEATGNGTGAHEGENGGDSASVTGEW